MPAGRKDVGAVIAVAARRRDEGAGHSRACAGTAGSVTASASAAAMKIVRVIVAPLGRQYTRRPEGKLISGRPDC